MLDAYSNLPNRDSLGPTRPDGGLLPREAHPIGYRGPGYAVGIPQALPQFLPQDTLTFRNPAPPSAPWTTTTPMLQTLPPVTSHNNLNHPPEDYSQKVYSPKTASTLQSMSTTTAPLTLPLPFTPSLMGEDLLDKPMEVESAGVEENLKPVLKSEVSTKLHDNWLPQDFYAGRDYYRKGGGRYIGFIDETTQSMAHAIPPIVNAMGYGIVGAYATLDAITKANRFEKMAHAAGGTKDENKKMRTNMLLDVMLFHGISSFALPYLAIEKVIKPYVERRTPALQQWLNETKGGMKPLALWLGKKRNAWAVTAATSLAGVLILVPYFDKFAHWVLDSYARGPKGFLKTPVAGKNW